MGLSLLSGTIGGGCYKAPDPTKAIQDNYHFRHLLYRFAGHVTEDQELTKNEERCLKKLGHHCVSFLHLEDQNCCAYTQLVSTLTDILKTAEMPQVVECCIEKQNTRYIFNPC